MSLFLIPTIVDPFFTLRISLDGAEYTLDFNFNQRVGAYYMHLSDALGSKIVSGVKLVPGVPLLRYKADPRVPAGQLFVVCSGADDSPPGLGDLGPDERCGLYYMGTG